jgi:hypothetical protein
VFYGRIVANCFLELKPFLLHKFKAFKFIIRSTRVVISFVAESWRMEFLKSRNLAKSISSEFRFETFRNLVKTFLRINIEIDIIEFRCRIGAPRFWNTSRKRTKKLRQCSSFKLKNPVNPISRI